MADKPKRPINIVMSVRVDDGTFESELKFPVDCGPEQIREMFLGWMGALNVALKMSGSAEVSLEPST